MNHKELCETTRAILGKTFVPASGLREVNSAAGTAVYEFNGIKYMAVLSGKSFKLTGEFA